MQLTPLQTIIIVIAVALGACFTRFTPFILFPEGKNKPQVITYLSKYLPAAMIGLLVVYCLKDVNFLENSHGIPEIISIAVLTIIHLWKKNVLLSILVSTLIYMILVQTVFI